MSLGKKSIPPVKYKQEFERVLKGVGISIAKCYHFTTVANRGQMFFIVCTEGIKVEALNEGLPSLHLLQKMTLHQHSNQQLDV